MMIPSTLEHLRPYDREEPAHRARRGEHRAAAGMIEAVRRRRFARIIGPLDN